VIISLDALQIYTAKIMNLRQPNHREQKQDNKKTCERKGFQFKPRKTRKNRMHHSKIKNKKFPENLTSYNINHIKALKLLLK